MKKILALHNYYTVFSFFLMLFFCTGYGNATISITNIQHSYMNECNGSISVQASGNAGPFELSLLDENENSVQSIGDFSGNYDFNDICAGSYFVVVTNSLQCETRMEVLVNNCPQIILKGLDEAIEPPTNCQSNDGGLYFRFGGPAEGTAPYTNTLYDMDGNVIPQGSLGWGFLSAGIYTLSVEDANGCTADFEIELVAELGMSLAASVPTSPCPGEQNGSIELIILSNSPYSILWSNGETTEEITGLAEGSYSVTISDGICDDIVEVFNLAGLQLDPLFVNTTVTNTCSGKPRGAIYVSPFGGRRPYSIQWSHDPTITAFGVNQLSAGNEYCVTVTDGCGASFEDCYTIQDSPPIVITGIVTDACPVVNEHSQFPPSLGSIQLNVSGGTSNSYSYQWNHSEYYTGGYPTQLEPGEYCVTVSNNIGGCQTIKCFTVNERPQPTIVISNYQQCEGNDCSGAFIDITVTGGNPDSPSLFTYDWFGYVDGGQYFEADTEDVSNLPGPGNYCVTVSSSDECTISKCVEIKSCKDVAAPNIIDISSIPPSPVFPLGIIRPDVSPQDDEFNYSWTGPNGLVSSDKDLEPANGPGEYTVTVDNGCGDVATRSITLEECILDLTFEPINNECSAENQAPFSVIVANSSPDDVFFFFNPGTQSFGQAGSGYYDSETSSTKLDFRTGVVTNYEFAIVNQDGCGGTVLITIGESEVHAEIFDFVQFNYDYHNQAYIPTYCMRATQCGDYLANLAVVSEVEITSYLTGSNDCSFNISCGESVLQSGIPGQRILTSGVSETGTHCQTGEYCVGETTMNATNYLKYIALLDTVPGNHNNIPPTFFDVYLKDPISVTQTGPVEESVEIDEDTGGCRRLRRCNGEIVEETNLGFPTSRLEYRSNGTEGGICYEVTYCGSIEMSAVPTSINNEFCTIYAIVSDENDLDYLSEMLPHRLKNNILDSIGISPKPIYKEVLPIESKKEFQNFGLVDRYIGSYIFPNPNSGICNIVLADANDNTEIYDYRIVVTDLLGKELLVKHVQSNRSSIDLTEFQDGYYIVAIYNQEDSTRTHHLMIKQ